MSNLFLAAQTQLDEVAALLHLPPEIHSLLREPMREHVVRFPVRMDDDSTRVFTGFRVQYNHALGPCKGGLRFHPEETVDTVRALAAWMTWKTALVDLPLGGGKGGVICNPKQLSEGELERVSRGFIRAIAKYIDDDVDVPAPDVYTNPQVMAWMMDEFATIRGHHRPGVITGKPVHLGGSLGRDDATARGGMYTIREAASNLGLDLSQATAVIQGYGNAGAFAHKLIEQLFGTKVIAISDSRGAIHSADGIDAQAAQEHKDATGSVVGLAGATRVEPEDLLELETDVLIPAALENVIHSGNAERIRAKIVAELANGPTTPEADPILHARGVRVIPDFLCNAGGVTVSYFEQVQNLNLDRWKLEQVHWRLDERMTEAFHTVEEKRQSLNVHPRLAAYAGAVERVARACIDRGWISRSSLARK